MIVNNETISIICPVYNVAAYLDRCLRSILDQTYTNIEVILVDDGSSDGSGLICDQWKSKDDRVVVLHQKNKGLSNARNEGLKFAHGKYIGYVDSDDWIAHDMYQILHDCITKEKADIACGKVVRVTGEKVDDSSGCPYSYMVETKDEYAKKYFRITSDQTVHYVWNKLYRRSVADKIRFPEGLIAEDVEGFFYALVNSDKIVNVDRDMYYYRYNPKGISSDWFSKKQMDIIQVWENVYKYCVDHSIVDWIYYAKINYHRAYFGVLTRLLISGKNKEFLDEKRMLIKNTRKYYWSLIKISMSFSRKALMTGMCISFDMTEKIYRFLHSRGLIGEIIS